MPSTGEPSSPSFHQLRSAKRQKLITVEESSSSASVNKQSDHIEGKSQVTDRVIQGALGQDGDRREDIGPNGSTLAFSDSGDQVHEVETDGTFAFSTAQIVEQMQKEYALKFSKFCLALSFNGLLTVLATSFPNQVANEAKLYVDFAVIFLFICFESATIMMIMSSPLCRITPNPQIIKMLGRISLATLMLASLDLCAFLLKENRIFLGVFAGVVVALPLLIKRYQIYGFY
ncbi:uncharacterized protein LOC110100969 [Dendrobium catenatum]|uniref:uncharacterized protein LOC110100969 n=1 Tax=Dendrobium catenatum TaxID=906689 RepID=UPI00109EFE3E|nr:uncharacterized protein LOC110100969 [Dendrobium catenatum]